MKIVCDACQAKYSIADDKIQGKAFKIRCKKCNHIIVVKVGADGAASSSTSSAPSTDKPRATGSHAASRASASHAVSAAAARSPSPATAPAQAPEQAVWHVVVDGEQVGPLSESEIKDRLRQGKVNSDTLVWKEGFGDWTAFSAVPELTPLLARITHHPVASKPAAREPGRATGSQKAVAAAAAPAADDPFAAATVVSPAGTADLFASAMATPQVTALPVQSPAPTSPFLFGGGAPAQPAEQIVVRNPGGNGAGSTHLTGQRNENSVLFSLSNLEALAVPAQQSAGIRSPSASGNTEGSGLIDIRSMAAMTLSDGAPDTFHRGSADALPTFSTPQFSPVAPVLLPMSTSGPPKWVFPVGALLAVGILVVGFMIFRIGTAPPPGLAPVPPPPPPAPAAPAPAAAAPSAAPTGEAAKPATAEEKPADKAAEEKPADKAKSGKGDRGDKGKKKGGDQAKGSADTKKGSDTSASSSPSDSAPVAKPAGKKGAKSLDDLLGEVGNKKGGGDDTAAKAAPVKLITLSQSDIVGAMKAVQPKVQACANQFKAPGTAMASISVASGGRVNSATVTGKFAGTPTGSCVESAAKSAKFPPCQAMSFPWPFTLSPR
jgi:predicted Zn finger-like uncharacterized protein